MSRCPICLSTLCTLLLACLGHGHAHAQTFQWFDGNSAATQTLSCVFNNPETLTLASLGYYGADDASRPYVGEPYYARAIVGTVGNPCPGGAQVTIEILLPLATVPVVGNSEFYTRCFLTQLSTDQRTEYLDGSCPLVPAVAPDGRWSYNPNPAFGPAWPVPSGHMLEIYFPVRSLTTLNGVADGDAARFAGVIRSYDGLTDPYSFPQQWVFVAPNSDRIFGNGFQ